LVGVGKGDLVNLHNNNDWLRLNLLFISFRSKDFLLRVSSLGVLGLLNRLGLSGLWAELGQHVLADELVGKSVQVVHFLVADPLEKLLSLVFRDVEDNHQVHGVLFVLGELVVLLELLDGLLLGFLLSFLLSFQGLLLSFHLSLLGLLLSLLLSFQGLFLSFLGLLLSFLELFLLVHLLGLFTVLEEGVEGFLGLLLEDSWIISARHERLFAFFVNDSKESMRSLAWVVELQKRVLVRHSGFAFLTEVEVFAN